MYFCLFTSVVMELEGPGSSSTSICIFVKNHINDWNIMVDKYNIVAYEHSFY